MSDTKTTKKSTSETAVGSADSKHSKDEKKVTRKVAAGSGAKAPAKKPSAAAPSKGGAKSKVKAAAPAKLVVHKRKSKTGKIKLGPKKDGKPKTEEQKAQIAADKQKAMEHERELVIQTFVKLNPKHADLIREFMCEKYAKPSKNSSAENPPENWQVMRQFITNPMMKLLYRHMISKEKEKNPHFANVWNSDKKEWEKDYEMNADSKTYKLDANKNKIPIMYDDGTPQLKERKFSLNKTIILTAINDILTKMSKFSENLNNRVRGRKRATMFTKDISESINELFPYLHDSVFQDANELKATLEAEQKKQEAKELKVKAEAKEKPEKAEVKAAAPKKTVASKKKIEKAEESMKTEETEAEADTEKPVAKAKPKPKGKKAKAAEGMDTSDS